MSVLKIPARYDRNLSYNYDFSKKAILFWKENFTKSLKSMEYHFKTFSYFAKIRFLISILEPIL